MAKPKYKNHRDWIQAGPFYKWRTSPRRTLTQSAAALTVGVTMMTWQLWERGLGRPNEENMKVLVTSTGEENFAKQVRDWHDEKPDFVAAAIAGNETQG